MPRKKKEPVKAVKETKAEEPFVFARKKLTKEEKIKMLGGKI